MKFKSLPWNLFFIGTLLLTMSIVGGDSLNRQEVNRLIGINKTVISVKDSPNAKDEVLFNIDDMESLSREITFTAAFPTEIDSKSVCVTGTSSKYPNFENMQFYNGCFFDKTAEASADKVVVIDEQLAWDVFGSLNVVGNNLEIFNQEFRVLGVVAADKSIIGLLSDSGVANAFVPCSTLLELDETARINALQIHNNDTSLTGQNNTEAVNFLRILGKNPEDYHISDFHKKSTLMAQKPHILVFIAGLASITVLLRGLISRGKELHIYLRREIQNDYMANILKYNKSVLLRKLLIMLLFLLIMAWVWRLIKFDMYIPPERLPKQLIDLAFYLDLLKADISASILKYGYIAPLAEIRLNKVTMLANILFYAGLLIGFPMVWVGLKLNQWHNAVALPQTLRNISLAYIISVSLSAIVTLLASISLNLNITDLAVVFSFIYIYAIYSIQEKEGARCEEKNVCHHDFGTDCR